MFDKLHSIELDLIKQLQTIRNPILDGIMFVLNLVDTMPFYIFLILCVWFFYNQKQGIRLFFLYLFSAFLNQSFKILFGEPRPCTLDPAVRMIKTHSFGFPSGAAQSMVVIFGFLSITFKRHWFWCLSIGSILLISFSRIYLGLHFFSDIIGGWILGIIILVGYAVAFPSIELFFSNRSRIERQILSLFICSIFWFFTSNLHTKASVIAAFGVSTGLIWGSLPSETPFFLQKSLRLLIAIAGIALIIVLVFFLFGFQKFASLLCDLLVSFWLGFGVSFVCKKIESSKKK